MKGIRKRAAAVALGVCMAAGAALGLAACDWVADDPAVSNPSDSGGTLFDPEDPVTEPEEPSAGGTETEDPEQGGSETEDPEQGGSETEDPEQGGETEPEDPEQGGTNEPEEPAPSGPSLDEIMAAYDTIYGYEVTADGRDFVRDESGDPVTVFKNEELYETVQNFLDQTISATSSTTFRSRFYGDFSEVVTLLTNYNHSEKKYTIISLCKYKLIYSNTKNDKTLNILEIPMDIDAANNTFSELELQLDALVPKNLTATEYDYKLSNIEYADDYLPEGFEYTDKEFADGCINAVYGGGARPGIVLGLLEDYFSQPGGNDLGMQAVANMAILAIENDTVTVFTKSLRIAERGNGSVYNILHNYNDTSYVVILDGYKLDGDETGKTINLDKVFYNDYLIEKILAA